MFDARFCILLFAIVIFFHDRNKVLQHIQIVFISFLSQFPTSRMHDFFSIFVHGKNLLRKFRKPSPRPQKYIICSVKKEGKQ